MPDSPKICGVVKFRTGKTRSLLGNCIQYGHSWKYEHTSYNILSYAVFYLIQTFFLRRSSRQRVGVEYMF